MDGLFNVGKWRTSAGKMQYMEPFRWWRIIYQIKEDEKVMWKMSAPSKSSLSWYTQLASLPDAERLMIFLAWKAKPE